MAVLSLGFHTEEPAPSLSALVADSLPAGLEVKLVPFDNVSQLTGQLASGALDLAFLEEPLAPVEGLRTVSELYPAALHILLHRDVPNGDLGAVLSSGSIWAGSPGGIGYSLASALAADYGAPAPRLLDNPWSESPAVYFIFGGLLKNDALVRLSDYRLYSVGTIEEGQRTVAHGMALRYPNLHPFVLPADLYPRLSREAALTVSVKTLLVGRADLDSQQVYELARAIDHLGPTIASAYPLAGVAELSRSGNSPRAIPWHPGARRYRDRELPSLIERYAEFVGATVTLLIAIISLGVAWYRRRRQARKDRLDSYYQQALAYRDALRAGGQAGDVSEGLRALQAEVFELLVAERIDADNALIAFLSLSNQLLKESADSLKSVNSNG